VVGVERVARGVRDDQLRLELADQVGQLLDGGGVHDEWVVTEVEATEIRTQHGRSGLRLPVADLLHPLLGLTGFLPELARLSALAVRQCDHVRRAALADDRGDRTRGAPDEVGGVCADDEDRLRHWPAPSC